MTAVSGKVFSVRHDLRLAVVQCPTCVVEYAIPEQLKETLLQEKAKASTTCPNGHGWRYTGKSMAEQLAEEQKAARQAEQRARDLEKQVQRQQELVSQAERAVRALQRGRSTAAERPKAECPVCHQKFTRLSTHRTVAKHYVALELA